jgi:hypothetical protein
MSALAQNALSTETNANQPDETCVTADTKSGTMLMMSRGIGTMASRRPRLIPAS